MAALPSNGSVRRPAITLAPGVEIPWNDFKTAVFGAVHHAGGGGADAELREEILSATAEKLVRCFRRPDFELKGSVRSLSYAIARNLVFERYRRRNRIQARDALEGWNGRHPENDQLLVVVCPEPTPEEAFLAEEAKRERCERLDAALGQLRPRDQQAIAARLVRENAGPMTATERQSQKRAIDRLRELVAADIQARRKTEKHAELAE
jgi:hypothetical protein